jgi:competence protein ComEA
MTASPPTPPLSTPPTRREALIARGEQFVLVLLGLGVVAGIGYRTIEYMGVGSEPVEVVPAAAPSFQIDVNSADWVTLSIVPGVGEKLARRIVAERDRRGGRFTSLDELKSVAGIKDKVLDHLRPYLTIDGEAAGQEPVRMKPRATP